MINGRHTEVCGDIVYPFKTHLNTPILFAYKSFLISQIILKFSTEHGSDCLIDFNFVQSMAKFKNDFPTDLYVMDGKIVMTFDIEMNFWGIVYIVKGPAHQAKIELCTC